MNIDATVWTALLSGDDARISATVAQIAPGSAEAVALAARLAGLLEGAEPLALRIAAGRALAWLGDPRDLDALIEVPAGPFIAGDPGEMHTIAAAYRIGRYPVTNLQYARFVAATGRPAPVHWDAATGRFAPGIANHPVVFVSWHDAQAYCAWRTAQTGIRHRLPGEGEWERAARGTDGRAYPWGDVFDPARANVHECGLRSTTPVGAFAGGASDCGALDMAGNVWEWTDAQNERANDSLRGGSWMQYGMFARCAFRHAEPRHAVLNDSGFRVVTG
ncbi:MAG: SUMF1/EgtB/PvdO family nonheme iron enzyme [Chloroflexi bacterium]|nr:SUMF1/EgtB/PvdO family nonheme iron enzyme [Chloroflexota bacterium]